MKGSRKCVTHLGADNSNSKINRKHSDSSLTEAKIFPSKWFVPFDCVQYQVSLNQPLYPTMLHIPHYFYYLIFSDIDIVENKGVKYSNTALLNHQQKKSALLNNLFSFMYHFKYKYIILTFSIVWEFAITFFCDYITAINPHQLCVEDGSLAVEFNGSININVLCLCLGRWREWHFV